MGIFNRKKEINHVEEEEGLFETQEDSSDSDIPDLTDAPLSLPYSRISDQCVAFDDPNLKRLLPSCQLRLSVQDVYMKGKKIWYLLELEHGSFKWFLKKRFRETLYLHHQLQMLRAFCTIQFPEISLETDVTTRRPSIVLKSTKIPKLPKLPLSKQMKSDPVRRMAAMENYLKGLLKIPCFRNAQDTLEFLEIGPLSFVEDLGPKGKEGYVWKRCCYQDTAFGLFDSLCLNGCTFWKKRWLFLKENFMALMNSNNGQLDGVLLLDRAFRVFVDKRATRSKDGIMIQNLNKKLYLRCENEHQAEDWAAEINYVLNGFQADFVRANSYGSYAPSRSLSKCRWIVDGATYFEAVAEVLEKAKEEIFITDWWLTPEIYLKRPTVHGHYWQLDYLLRRKARSGVRIYILLYKELELALGINSFHSQQKLIRMHKNIKVLRHPEVKKGILLWAHHEKLVCVDQTYAFVGGLDLCYGRWDDYQHRLSDFGDFEKKLKILRHMSTAIPNDISANYRIRRTSSLPHVSSEEIQVAESNTKPRQIPKFKTIVRKLQAAKEFERLQQTLTTEQEDTKNETERILSDLIPADRRRTIQQMTLTVLGMERKFRLWHGKDYVNFICRDFENLHQPYTDIIDRKTTPRMPWHDIGVFVEGEPARDIARHFIVRWNQAKEEICPEDFTYPYIMPKAYAKFSDNTSSWLCDIIGTIYSAECQVLRSLCLWSGGISETENSIQEAYIQVIREAKHFIYIENQFFISQPSGDRNVLNGIADALYYRILKAHRNRNLFRVYVLLPLLPAFEGELGKGSGTLIQVITHWNYKSICRGPNSLYRRLSCHMKDPSAYITFYGLRTYGYLGNKVVTELIYVHSKTVIADDTVAIIGSANINDRSLLGRRDSEIAVLVRDTQFLDQEEGRPHKAGKFCYSLRTALFREHLGLMQSSEFSIDIRDPASDSFYREIWQKTATENAHIYEEVFQCIPTDKVRNFHQLREYQAKTSLANMNAVAAKDKVKKIRGHLVAFPMFFLCEEKLKPTLSVKEHYLPNSVWT